MRAITFNISKAENIFMDLKWSYSKLSWIIPQLLLFIFFITFLCLGRKFLPYSLFFGIANLILPLRQVIWTFRTWRLNPQVLAPITIQWDEKGLYVKSILSEAKHPWTSFVKWKESGKYIRLVITPSRVISIPKRELTSEHLENLRRYAKQSLERKE